jgi:hypothetical protein
LIFGIVCERIREYVELSEREEVFELEDVNDEVRETDEPDERLEFDVVVVCSMWGKGSMELGWVRCDAMIREGKEGETFDHHLPIPSCDSLPVPPTRPRRFPIVEWLAADNACLPPPPGIDATMDAMAGWWIGGVVVLNGELRVSEWVEL